MSDRLGRALGVLTATLFISAAYVYGFQVGTSRAPSPVVAKTAVVEQAPGLPDSVPSFVGPVPVVIKPNLSWRQQPVYGLFLENQRRIELRSGTAPRFLCAVLIHERVHLALHDAGVFIADDDLEDRIADAIMQHFALGVC